jgi:VanZ family protein
MAGSALCSVFSFSPLTAHLSFSDFFILSDHFSSQWIRGLPALLWGVLILVLSLMPGDQTNLMMFGIPHFDKIGHFGMYAVWALLAYYAFSGISRISFRSAFLMAIVVCGLTGVVLEFGQYYFARGRSFEVADMLANAAGAIVGGFVGWKWKMLLKQ